MQQQQALYGGAPPTGYAVPANVVPMEQRARPFFRGGPHSPANKIRGYYSECCCGLRPGTGPNVPPHWYDGGKGWTTAHFVDVEPFDLEAQQQGVHRCKLCNFQAEGGECCGKGMCWCPLGRAPGEMEAHLIGAHGMQPPPRRQWASDLCDTTGCLDACCCWQCQASRQIMAAHGFANQLNFCWCLYFTFAGGRHYDENGQKVHAALIGLAAWMTRNSIRELHNIDESCCMTALTACCCPVCSLAQTYREYSAAGVWPGGVCNGDEPPQIMMNLPPPHLQQGVMPAGQQQGPAGSTGYQKLV